MVNAANQCPKQVDLQEDDQAREMPTRPEWAASRNSPQRSPRLVTIQHTSIRPTAANERQKNVVFKKAARRNGTTAHAMAAASVTLLQASRAGWVAVVEHSPAWRRFPPGPTRQYTSVRIVARPFGWTDSCLIDLDLTVTKSTRISPKDHRVPIVTATSVVQLPSTRSDVIPVSIIPASLILNVVFLGRRTNGVRS